MGWASSINIVRTDFHQLCGIRAHALRHLTNLTEPDLECQRVCDNAVLTGGLQNIESPFRAEPNGDFQRHIP